MNKTLLSMEEQLETAAPVWPAFTQTEVEEVWKAYGYHSKVSLTRPTLRMMTSGAMIAAPEGDFFLKRFHDSVTDTTELLAKHQFANLLKKQLAKMRQVDSQTVDVVEYLPVKTKGSTTTVVKIGHWLYEMQSKAIGDDRYGSIYCWEFAKTAEELVSFGMALAQIHLATETLAGLGGASSINYLPPDPGIGFYEWRCQFLADYCRRGATAITSFLAQRPALTDWLKAKDHHLESDLNEYLPELLDTEAYYCLPQLWIHGDGHVSNVAYTGNRVSSFFDFGLACVSPLVADLATALERNTIAWLDITAGHEDAYRSDFATAIINGYQQIRPLNQAEKNLLPQLLTCIQMEPALNLIGYHLKTTHPENADWSYNIFFKQHSAWFRTASGKKYLDSLNQILK